MAEAFRTALMLGAAGVIGRGLMQHLDGLPDRHAIGISRRPPVEGHSAWSRYLDLAVDLLDPATAEVAANQGFNLTNGDFFRRQNPWPRLAETMADKAPVWGEVVRAHGLQPNELSPSACRSFALAQPLRQLLLSHGRESSTLYCGSGLLG